MHHSIHRTIYKWASIHFIIHISAIRVGQAEWSPWNAWSLCYEQNGISAQTRTRAWLGDPTKNPGNDQQARACLPAEGKTTPTTAAPAHNPAAPPPPPPQQQPVMVLAQAEWSQWTEWSECQSLPGGSSPPFRTRWRICDRRKCDAAQGVNIGGSGTKVECQPCSGQPMEQQNCPIPAPSSENSMPQHDPEHPVPLPPPPIFPTQTECQWSDWSNWSSCSTTCGTGIRIRMRVCPCAKCHEGPSQEEENCYNLLPCQSDGHSSSSVVLPPPPPPPPQIIPWNNGEWAGFNLTGIGATAAGFNPCNYCPPMYALPCYTCLSMPFGK